MNNDIRVILFDFDQTLLELGETHFVCLNMALKEIANLEISKKEHKLIYNGLSTKKKLELLTKNKNLDDSLYQKIYDKKQQLTIEQLKKFKPTIQFKELFRILKKKGYKIGICSNAIKETIYVGMELLKIENYVDLVLSNTDVKYQKPNPEIYMKACCIFDISPLEAVVCEDGKYGIESAEKAGCNVIKVKSPKEVHEKLIKFLNKYEKS